MEGNKNLLEQSLMEKMEEAKNILGQSLMEKRKELRIFWDSL
jgi:hypothetical protein